jgi:hypothetical protein
MVLDTKSLPILKKDMQISSIRHYQVHENFKAIQYVNLKLSYVKFLSEHEGQLDIMSISTSC